MGSFSNLILKVTSSQFGRILFIRSKSLIPANIQGEGIAQEHEQQEAGITEAIVKAVYIFKMVYTF